jgi:hypothetical protein
MADAEGQVAYPPPIPEVADNDAELPADHKDDKDEMDDQNCVGSNRMERFHGLLKDEGKAIYTAAHS